MNAQDFLSPCEKNREKMHAAICERYVALRRSFPDVSRHRLTIAIGKEMGYTPQHVGRVLARNGYAAKDKNLNA